MDLTLPPGPAGARSPDWRPGAVAARPRPPLLPASGDPRHGVVRYARELAAGVTALGAGPADRSRVHVHVTDRLWGASPEQAAARFAAFAARRRVTVTLHDLPQPSDGPRLHARRAAAYATVAAAARGVVVNGAHEAALLDEVLPGHRAAVIPLPVMPRASSSAPRPTLRAEVAILGWIYPGKGHAEAIDAVAAADLPVEIVALGAPSAGHEADVAALRERARRREVAFTVTGYLDEPTLLARCRRAGVGLTAHQHVSASGSIGSWMAAGRRPLVPDGRHARDLERLRPGTLTRYTDLPGALTAALAHPASTRLDPGCSTRPHLEDVAQAYLAWWREVDR